jgi:acyl-CoA hydrolase
MKKRDTNAERIKETEEELAKLETPEVVEEVPENKEEATFKKRYGDLRRHSQQKETQLQKQIDELRTQLETVTKKEIKLPKSDEEVEEWCQAYPDVAKIVETIAIKKAKEMTGALEGRIKKVDEMEATTRAEKAEVELMRLHPDFNEIRDTDEFHDWVEQQPKWIQDALYDNDNDARAAARAIDLYKADQGLNKKKATDTSRDAAKNVNTRGGRNQPATTDTDVIRESDVKRMSDREYEANEDKIMQAMRSGKFVYDVSGNAR